MVNIAVTVDFSKTIIYVVGVFCVKILKCGILSLTHLYEKCRQYDC